MYGLHDHLYADDQQVWVRILPCWGHVFAGQRGTDSGFKNVGSGLGRWFFRFARCEHDCLHGIAPAPRQGKMQ